MKIKYGHDPECEAADRLELAGFDTFGGPRMLGLRLIRDGQPIGWIAIERLEWDEMYRAGVEAIGAEWGETTH